MIEESADSIAPALTSRAGCESVPAAARAVVLVTDRWDPRGGGRERYLAQLATFLAGRGRQVLVLCRKAAVNAGRPGEGIEVRAFPGPAAVGERRLRSALGLVVRERPGVAVLAARPQREATHYQMHSGLLRDSFAAERASMPSALRRALYWPALRFNPRRLGFLREEEHLLGPDSRTRLMAFSAATADGWREGPAARRTVVCPPGVDRTLFSRESSGGGPGLAPGIRRPYFLFVGHNFRLKGLAPALEALSRLGRGGDRAGIVVAGPGPVRPWVRLASRLGLPEAPAFLGDVDQEGLAALYRNAAALVHPAYYDPYPRVVPEALACGCPVVTTESCGASGLIADGRNGFVVRGPGDVEGLARGMHALLDGGAREAAGAAAALSAEGLGLPEHLRKVEEWLGLAG